MKKILLLAVAACSGCVAANPDKIKPMSISTVGYQLLDCAALASEDRRVAGELGPMIFYQRQRRGSDFVGAVAVGLTPTGMGAPENGASIARPKGERETIATVKASKGCTEPQAIVNDQQPEDERKRMAERAAQVAYR